MKKEIINSVFDYIPNDFDGTVLDIPPSLAGKLPNAKVKTVREFYGRLEYDDDYFDMVLSIGAFHKFDGKDVLFDEICRVLKTGGKLIAALYTESDSREFDLTYTFEKKAPPLYTVPAFREKLKARFDVNSFHTKNGAVYFEAVLRKQ